MKINFNFIKIIIGYLLLILLGSCSRESDVIIYVNQKADKVEKQAAREVRKYIYQRTGKLFPINKFEEDQPIRGNAILVGSVCKSSELPEDALPELSADDFILKTISSPTGKKFIIYGGSNISTLYAAYYYAEQLGIGFYLEGDVIPDKQIPFVFPELDMKQTSLFNIRGIQPFHDFPEGPDWWSIDDYKGIIAQLPKLRMNFIGFHTYPEGVVGPEPMVWIGSPQEIGANGKVKSSYKSSHFTTVDGDPSRWGYKPMKTSDYYFGASQMYEKDIFGADYMMKFGSVPQSPKQQNGLFNDFGYLLKDAFTFAKELGVKTCIGTEIPLTIPRNVKEHLSSSGKNPKDTEVIREVYEGIFQRIMDTHPLDYYWFWTPEGWTWNEVEQSKVDNTISDIKSAITARKSVNAPFTLATCGWVLGPPQDRVLFDNVLPKDMPLSTINREFGWMPVEPGFAKIKGRPKWAIPWLEDDPALIIPQLWVGRIRRDAADALAYGCTGLIGIHWRTRILGPNVSALAHAAWDQQGCNPDFPNPDNPFKNSEPTLQAYESGEKNRDLPSMDFYVKWAKISFGNEVSSEIATVFSKLDGTEYKGREENKSNLPRPSTWVGGPGGINPDKRSWKEVNREYMFINELEELRSKISGNGNIERFDYWLNHFRYLRELGHFNCVWFQFNEVMNEIKKIENSADQRKLALNKALQLRIEMVSILTKMQNYLISSTTTYGGMGNITNWQQHNLPRVMHEPGQLLEKYLGEELPEKAKLPREYTGHPHMFVSKARSILERGESLDLKIRTISPENAKPVGTKIFWRKLGESEFSSHELNHVARGVYQFQIDSVEIPESGLEYYVEVNFENGETIKFPATAPKINQASILLSE